MSAVHQTIKPIRSKALDISVHIAAPLLLSLIGLAAALIKVYEFDPNDWDYGIFSNLLWNFANGNGWLMSLYDGRDQAFFLADHLALLTPIFAPLFYFFPSPYTLSVLHSAAFAATFFLAPIYVKAVWNEAGRKNYLWPALFLLLSLSLFRGFAAAWSYQSHMTTLVTPVLLCALIALHYRATLWVIMLSLTVALAQERASVAVFGIGMYAYFIIDNKKLGISLCAFSVAYFFLAVKIIIPSFSSGDYGYSSAINPAHELDEKFEFLYEFYSFWFFLPLIGKRAFLVSLCAFPVLGLGLVSERSAMYGYWHHYQDLPSVFFFAASAFGLLRLTDVTLFDKIPKKVIVFLAFVCLYSTYDNSKRYIPARYLVNWQLNPETVRLNKEINAYSNLPPDIKVYTSSGIGPRFTMRKHRYVISPQVAAQKFSSSMIFIAPTRDMFPFNGKTDELLTQLKTNSSLSLTKHTPELLVFKSKDLLKDIAEESQLKKTVEEPTTN